MFHKWTTVVSRSFAKKSDFARRLRQEIDDPEALNNAATSRRRSTAAQHNSAVGDSGLLGEKAATTEYPGINGPEEEMEHEALRNLSVTPTKINSVLEDYLLSSNKADALSRSELLLESVRRGDYRLFSETSQAEFMDLKNRFDIYRENFIAQDSNNRMKVTELANDKQRLEAQRDLGVLLRFEQSVGLNYGIPSDSPIVDDQGMTKKQRQEATTYHTEAYEELTSNPGSENSPFTEELDSRTPVIPDNFGLDEDPQKTKTRFQIEDRLTEVEDRLNTYEFLRDHDTDLFYEVAGNEVLSFRAKLGIYKCYLEGWNVREISVRYGILPNRVKAVVWSMQHFMEEYLPDITTAELVQLIMLEAAPRPEVNFVDYGLDAEIMAEEQEGVVSKVFLRNKLGPHIAKNWELELTKDQIQERLRKKVVKKEDFIIETFKLVGRNKRPYAMKNWIIHRGKGSARVNAMFKRILESSHCPDTLPPNVRRRLDQGPRIASQGDTHR